MSAKFKPVGEPRKVGSFVCQTEQRGLTVRYRLMDESRGTVSTVALLSAHDVLDLTALMDDVADVIEGYLPA